MRRIVSIISYLDKLSNGQQIGILRSAGMTLTPKFGCARKVRALVGSGGALGMTQAA